jgi:hypothetical protein
VPRLHVLVEGQTEEVVVNEVIKPYFSNFDVWVTVSIFTTNDQLAGQPIKAG